MKSYIFLITIMFFATSCGSTSQNKSSQSKNTQVAVTPLKGYFIKNTIEDTGELQCFVFTDQLSMSQICGTAATMSSKPDVPDFNNSIVIAITGKSTDRPTTINIVETKIEDKALVINVAEEVSDKESSYTMRPLTIATVDKAGIKNVVFRKGGVDIANYNL